MIRKNNDSFLIGVSLFISGFIILYLYNRDYKDLDNDEELQSVTIVNNIPEQRLPREEDTEHEEMDPEEIIIQEE